MWRLRCYTSSKRCLILFINAIHLYSTRFSRFRTNVFLRDFYHQETPTLVTSSTYNAIRKPALWLLNTQRPSTSTILASHPPLIQLYYELTSKEDFSCAVEDDQLLTTGPRWDLRDCNCVDIYCQTSRQHSFAFYEHYGLVSDFPPVSTWSSCGSSFQKRLFAWCLILSDDCRFRFHENKF